MEDDPLCWGKFGQLFDLEKDPLEAKNLWDDSSYDSEKRSLQEVFIRLAYSKSISYP